MKADSRKLLPVGVLLLLSTLAVNGVPAMIRQSATPDPKMPPVLVEPAALAGRPAAVRQAQVAAAAQAQAVPVPATSPAATAAEPGQQTQVTVVPQTAPAMPTTPTPIPQYTGEIATFELVDYPIRDFFRLISELSGLNVFLDPAVNGTVTMTLKDIPWDQALDVVLKNNNLGGQLQGNVLRIATNVTLQQEQNQAKALHDAQEAAAPLEVHTFVLNYTKAADVNLTLRGMTTPRGSIVVDPRRNALIVKDVPAQFSQLESMIKFVDMPQQQVDIEARLLSANKSFFRDIGNQLGLMIGANGGNVLTGVPDQLSSITRNQTLPTGGSSLPLVANFPAVASSGLSFFIKPGGDVLLDEIITAAEAKGTARLISRPHVTTQNNQAATIQQGTQIPVQTNVNNTITTQFVTFALQLDVTPQISAAGTILMQVNVTNSQPDFARAVGGIPSVASQSAKTLVMVPDGATAVIGGILVDDDSINIRQVPGLGTLSVIGTLVKETNTAKSTSELLFFITPRIKPLDTISVPAPSDNPPEQPQQR